MRCATRNLQHMDVKDRASVTDHLPVIDDMVVTKSVPANIVVGRPVPEGVMPIESATVKYWYKKSIMKYNKATESMKVIGRNRHGDILYAWRPKGYDHDVVGRVREESLIDYQREGS